MTFAGAALAATAFLCAASLRLRGTSFAVAGYLIAWVFVVGLSELLSFFDIVGRAGYVVGTGLALVASVLVWNRCGRPPPPLPSLRLADLRRHPLLAVLGAAVVCAVRFEAYLVVATPPNIYDSLTYHLPRVVAWL